MGNRFEVVVGAGTMMSAAGFCRPFSAPVDPGGVTVEAVFTGAQVPDVSLNLLRRSRDSGWYRVQPLTHGPVGGM